MVRFQRLAWTPGIAASLGAILCASSVGCRARTNPDAGIYAIEGTDGCAGLLVAGNVVVPYGITVTDCDGAQELVAQFTEQGQHIVVFASECHLEGAGDHAMFGGGCDGGDWAASDALPEAIGEGMWPRRDSSGKIPGHVKLTGAGSFHVILLERGMAEPGPACEEYSKNSHHYCEGVHESYERRLPGQTGRRPERTYFEKQSIRWAESRGGG